MLSAFYAFQFIRTWVNNKIGHIAEDAMMKADYDTDGDGVVDNAKRLNGNLSSYYAKVTDIKTYTAGNEINIDEHNVISATNFGFSVDAQGQLCAPVEVEEVGS